MTYSCTTIGKSAILILNINFHFLYFSITALGASGGTGVQNPKASMGGYVNAKFNLTKGDQIYMLVGQQGESACSQVSCLTWFNVSLLQFRKGVRFMTY